MLKTPFPLSVFALYLWLSVPTTLDSKADLRAVSNVTCPLYLSSIRLVFSPSYPQVWGSWVHSSRSQLFLTLLHFGPRWCFCFVFYASHTVAAWGHSSGNHTILLCPLSFYISGCAENIFFKLPVIPRWHSMPFTEKKKKHWVWLPRE